MEETRAFLAPDGQITASDIEAVHQQAGGWAAACVLVLEHQRHAEKGAGWMGSDSQQALFDYFVSEIFNRATPDLQRFLVQTALLPQITERLAVQLTATRMRQNSRPTLSPQLLPGPMEARRQLSISCVVPRFLAPTLSRSSTRRAATYGFPGRGSAGRGRSVPKLQLTLQSGHWPAATQRSAPLQVLLRTDAAQVLSWIAALPPAITEHEPWLAYWHGLAKIQTDELAARDAFERAYQGFTAQGRLLEQLLCASVFVQALYSDWGNFKGLKRWTERIAAGFARQPEFSSGAHDLCASTGYLCVAIATAAGGELIEARARHVRALLESLGEQVDPNEWLLSAETLMRYLVYVGGKAAIEDLIRLAEPVAASDHVSLLRRGRWLRYAGKACYYYVSEAAAMKYWTAAKSIAQTENFSELFLELLIYEARLALFNRNLARAAQLLPDIESRLDPQRPVWGALYHHVKCWYLLLQREPAAALGEIHHAVQLHREAETPESEMAFFRSWEVYSLVELGRIAEAIEIFESLLGGIHGENKRLWVTQLFRAYGALLDGDGKAAVYLEEGLRLAREGNRPLFSYVLPYVCRLCAEALRLGIESDHVKRFIRERKILAPAPDIENWPWPVKIYCLGRFGVLQDDMPIRSEGKAQRKPLELLKVLIALGGRDVPADKLIDEVWPEPLEGGGQKALDITVHRLRKMLDCEDAIQLSDRRVTLNTQIVWVDVWALERVLGPLVPAVSVSMPDIALLEAAVSTVLNLYRGPFLAGNEERPWRLTVQSRLSARFQRFALRLVAFRGGRKLGAGGRTIPARHRNWNRSGSLLPEAMVCLASRGQRAEPSSVSPVPANAFGGPECASRRQSRSLIRPYSFERWLRLVCRRLRSEFSTAKRKSSHEFIAGAGR